MDSAKFCGKTAERCLKYGSLAVFAIITFFVMLHRQPFFDEAHAWMVSKSFSFLEFFQIERYEGHLFLWHTFLMPFSKNNFFYPYSMFFLNWVFCLGALFIFWNKSPFSNLQKFLITFSYPFLMYFGPVARCYSLGLIFLFSILSFWNERLKHPYIVAVLLMFHMNTSAMAIIGAFPLGLIFAHDLIKSELSKKDKILPFSILLVGAILVLIQLYGAYHPDVEAFVGTHLFFYKFLIYFSVFDIEYTLPYFLEKTTAVLVAGFYFLSFAHFSNSKRVAFFNITTILLLLGLFIFKYPGAWWHYSFFYVYMIIAVWLYKIEGNVDTKRSGRAFDIVGMIILFLFVAQNPYFPLKSDVHQSRARDIAKAMKEQGVFAPNHKVYALDSFSQTSNGIMPYFDGEKLYTVVGDLKYSHDEYEHHMRKIDKETKVDYFAESLSKDKLNIGISDRELYPVYEGYHHLVLLKPLYEDKNFRVYGLVRAEKK